MRPKKFNFTKILMNNVPAGRSSVPVLSITKQGQMIISKTANREFGLDGALIDILFDAEKRALGFKKIESMPEIQWSKTMRILKADSKGFIKIPVGRILSALGIEKVNYSGLEIDKYQDIMEARTIYFVYLPKVVSPSKEKELIEVKE